MNKIESPTTSTAVNVHTEQAASVSVAEKEDLTTNFYIIGGVINITMILAYFIWAIGAWRRTDKRKEKGVS